MLELCIDKGMVGGTRQVIDSIAVQANALMESLLKIEIVNDADSLTKELGTEAGRVLSTRHIGRK